VHYCYNATVFPHLQLPAPVLTMGPALSSSQTKDPNGTVSKDARHSLSMNVNLGWSTVFMVSKVALKMVASTIVLTRSLRGSDKALNKGRFTVPMLLLLSSSTATAQVTLDIDPSADGFSPPPPNPSKPQSADRWCTTPVDFAPPTAAASLHAAATFSASAELRDAVHALDSSAHVGLASKGARRAYTSMSILPDWPAIFTASNLVLKMIASAIVPIACLRASEAAFCRTRWGVSMLLGSFSVASAQSPNPNALLSPQCIVTTIAGSTGSTQSSGGADGTGTNGVTFYGAGDIAIAPDGSFALSSNGGGHTIRRIEMSTRVVTTVAGSYSATQASTNIAVGGVDGVGTNARLSTPSGITLINNGAVAYFNDQMATAVIIKVAVFAASTWHRPR
jgi:hypothetical protein